MKQNLILFATFTTLMVATGCSPKYYVPNTQNVPLLTGRGDLSVSAAGKTNQVEAQGAFALTNHFGVMANGVWYLPKIFGPFRAMYFVVYSTGGFTPGYSYLALSGLFLRS